MNECTNETTLPPLAAKVDAGRVNHQRTAGNGGRKRVGAVEGEDEALAGADWEREEV